MAAGSAQLRARRKLHVLANPRIIAAPRHADLPFIARTILGWIHVDEELRADTTTTTT
jgi:hypothetical protein